MSSLPSDINSINRNAPRRRIVAVTAKTSTLVVYEVPAGKTLRVESMSFCNVTSLKVTFRMHVLGANESVSTSNAVYYNTDLTAHSTILDDSVRYLNAGDRIAVQSDTASALGIQIHGVEI